MLSFFFLFWAIATSLFSYRKVRKYTQHSVPFWREYTDALPLAAFDFSCVVYVSIYSLIFHFSALSLSCKTSSLLLLWEKFDLPNFCWKIFHACILIDGGEGERGGGKMLTFPSDTYGPVFLKRNSFRFSYSASSRPVSVRFTTRSHLSQGPISVRSGSQYAAKPLTPTFNL